MALGNIDADLHNADWTKRTWDIFDDNGKLVTTVKQLKQVFPNKDLYKFIDHPGIPPRLKTELTVLKDLSGQ